MFPITYILGGFYNIIVTHILGLGVPS